MVAVVRLSAVPPRDSLRLLLWVVVNTVVPESKHAAVLIICAPTGAAAAVVYCRCNSLLLLQ